MLLHTLIKTNNTHNSSVRSVEELTLGASAFQIFHGCNSTLSNSCDKSKFLKFRQSLFLAKTSKTPKTRRPGVSLQFDLLWPARLQNTRPLALNLKMLPPQSHSQSIIYSQSVEMHTLFLFSASNILSRNRLIWNRSRTRVHLKRLAPQFHFQFIIYSQSIQIHTSFNPVFQCFKYFVAQSPYLTLYTKRDEYKN